MVVIPRPGLYDAAFKNYIPAPANLRECWEDLSRTVKSMHTHKSTLSDNRIANLEVIGSKWSVGDAVFENNIANLMRYRKANGY